LVKFCVERGAFVCFGDLDEEAGKSLEHKISQLRASKGEEPTGVHFVATDVTNYQSVVGLFQACLERYGRIDSAISCAGIIEIGNWFDPTLDLDTIRTVSSSCFKTEGACCEY
jgi:NAD(P)-dependent dehydrogenase (short-subunit alcohol dehydrogenase family)